MKINNFKETDVLYRLMLPPKGYKLTNILATTFTMSKRMLGEILINYQAIQNNIEPSCLSQIQARMLLLDMEKENNINNNQVKIYADRIIETISSSTTAGLDQALCYLQKKFVKKINVKNGYFHPKIILCKFSKTDESNVEKIKYRISVSSKNLTYDSFFQAGVVLEGDYKKDNQKCNGKTLLDFLSSFVDECDKDWLGNLNLVNFEPVLQPDNEQGKKTVEESDNGQDNKQNKKLLNVKFCFTIPQKENETCVKSDRILCRLKGDVKDYENAWFISDTVSTEFPCYIGLDYIRKDNCFIMISNPKSWANDSEIKKIINDVDIESKLKGKFGYCNILSVAKKISDETPPYIHAKMFVIKKKNSLVIYVGSANCTVNAMINNYEFMVRLEYECSDDYSIECISYNEHNVNRTYKFSLLSEDKLKQGMKELNIDILFKGISFKVSKYDNNDLELSWEWVLPDDKVALCELKDKVLYFCVPNKNKKIELDYTINENGTIATIPIVYSCRTEQLPLNGTAKLLVCNGSGKKVMIVDVPIDIQEIENLSTNNDDKYEKAFSRLFQGLLIDVRDVIPHIPGSRIYDSNDTVDIRIAKYLAFRDDKDKNPYEILETRTFEILRKYNIEDYYDENDMYGCQGQYKESKAKLEHFKEIMEAMKK